MDGKYHGTSPLNVPATLHWTKETNTADMMNFKAYFMTFNKHIVHMNSLLAWKSNKKH